MKFKSWVDPPRPIARSWDSASGYHDDTSVSMAATRDLLLLSMNGVRWKGAYRHSNPFHAIHYSERFTSPIFKAYYSSGGAYSLGRARLNPTSFQSLTRSDSDGVGMDFSRSAGTTAIARTRPGDSVAGLSQFLLELKKDGIPSLAYDKRRGNLNTNGGLLDTTGFLNNKFGIQPTVSDLKSLYEVSKNIDTVLQQLSRDSGKTIRRSLTLRDLNTTNTVESTTMTATSGRFTTLNFGSGSRTTSEYRDYAFVARYRYHLNRSIGTRNHFGDTSGGYDLRYIAELYGATPNIELLYNLTPWTWLADYFGNFGDIIHNLTDNAADNLRMTDGCVFMKWRRSQTGSATFKYRTSGTNGTKYGEVGISYELESVINRRSIPNPYNFGPALGTLSDKQKGIIAAIGFNQFGKR